MVSSDEALVKAKKFFYSSEIGKAVLARGEQVIFGCSPKKERWVIEVYKSQRGKVNHGFEKDLEGAMPDSLATIVVEGTFVFFIG